MAKLLEGESNKRGLIMEILGQNDCLASHCLQVCIYGSMIVNRFFPEYSEQEKNDIALGFLSHDIGKVQVGTSITEKPGRPTRMEWKVLHQVPERGALILNQWGIRDGLAVEIVRNHRERFNGTGYPRQLRGEQIPKLARICCIADDFASLTTKKCYRPALSPYDALWIMRVDNVGYYDPSLLKLFLTMLVE
ncbi:MAG: HD-GYP domain-containing protein [Nitrospinota bacterium]